MPHRTRPMTALLVFTGLNVFLVSTITPVYDFVCFLPYWERRVCTFYHSLGLHICSLQKLVWVVIRLPSILAQCYSWIPMSHHYSFYNRNEYILLILRIVSNTWILTKSMTVFWCEWHDSFNFNLVYPPINAIMRTEIFFVIQLPNLVCYNVV